MPWYNCCKQHHASQYFEEPSTSAPSDASKGDMPPEEILTFITGSNWSRWRLIVILTCCFIMMFYGLNLFASELLVPENIDFVCVTKTKNISNSCYTANGSVCTKFDYSHLYGSTIIEKWNWVCDRKIEAKLCPIIFRCGLATGFIFYGFLADRWGRKSVLITSLILQPCFGILITTSPTPSFFLVSRFLYATSLTGTTLTALILVCEISPNKWRTVNLLLLCASIALGQALLPFIWVIIKDSMKNMLLLSMPQVLIVFFIGVIKESPSWFLCNNKPNKAEAVLISVLNFDGLDVPSTFRIRPVQITNLSSTPNLPLLQLLLSSTALFVVLAIFLLSILTSFTCGLMAAHILKTNKDCLKAILLLGISGICATSLNIGLHYYILRHNIIIAVSGIFACAVAAISNYGLSEIHQYGSLELILQFTIYGFFLIARYSVWNITPRLFPTDMRGEGTGIALALDELSFMAARLLYPKLYRTLTMFFSAFCGSVFTILLCCMLLHTVHKRELPDKIEDIINFKNSHKPVRWSTIRAASPTIDETEIKITDFEKETSIVVHNPALLKNKPLLPTLNTSSEPTKKLKPSKT